MTEGKSSGWTGWRCSDASFTSFSTSSLVPFLACCEGVCTGLWDCVPSSANPYTDCREMGRRKETHRPYYLFLAVWKSTNFLPRSVALKFKALSTHAHTATSHWRFYKTTFKEADSLSFSGTCKERLITWSHTFLTLWGFFMRLHFLMSISVVLTHPGWR